VAPELDELRVVICHPLKARPEREGNCLADRGDLDRLEMSPVVVLDELPVLSTSKGASVRPRDRELDATAEVSIVDYARKRLDPTQRKRRCDSDHAGVLASGPNQPNAVTRCNESLLAQLELVVEYERVGLMDQRKVGRSTHWGSYFK
jgi:hypothetical protein